MGVLERLRNMVRANVTDIISRAEDPEKQLEALIRRMEANLQEARAEIAAAARDERRLNEDLTDCRQQGDEWAQKARLAVEQSKDDLAREAIRRRLACERRAQHVTDELALQRAGVQTLRDHLAALEAKVEETRRYRDLIVAHRRLAIAQNGMARRAGVRASEHLDRIEDRVIEIEATAVAAQDELDTRLSVIEQRARSGEEDQAVERELAALKSEMAGRVDPADPPRKVPQRRKPTP